MHVVLFLLTFFINAAYGQTVPDIRDLSTMDKIYDEWWNEYCPAYRDIKEDPNDPYRVMTMIREKNRHLRGSMRVADSMADKLEARATHFSYKKLGEVPTEYQILVRNITRNVEAAMHEAADSFEDHASYLYTSTIVYARPNGDLREHFGGGLYPVGMCRDEFVGLYQLILYHRAKLLEAKESALAQLAEVPDQEEEWIQHIYRWLECIPGPLTPPPEDFQHYFLVP